MAKKRSKAEEIAAERNYVEFLKKRLDSKNYKNNVSDDEYNKTKQKYDKAKLKLRFLEEG